MRRRRKLSKKWIRREAARSRRYRKLRRGAKRRMSSWRQLVKKYGVKKAAIRWKKRARTTVKYRRRR